jgi:hypothetical protein
MAQLDQHFVTEKSNKESIELNIPNLLQDPILNAAFSETLRLQANGLGLRAIENNTTISALGQTYSFRKSETVIVSMAGVHKNPNIYANPEEFRLTRFMNATYDGGNAKVRAKDGVEVKTPYIWWGGGQHMVRDSFQLTLTLFSAQDASSLFLKSFLFRQHCYSDLSLSPLRVGHQIFPFRLPLQDMVAGWNFQLVLGRFVLDIEDNRSLS